MLLKGADIERFAGLGMVLGVFGRDRGVAATVDIIGRDGVCARKGGRKIGMGGLVDDIDVDPDDVIGDHGLEDPIDALERLRRCGEPIGGTGGISLLCEYTPNADGERFVGVAFTVKDLSSCWILVELFHRCFSASDLPLIVDEKSALTLWEEGSEGVKLLLCLCARRSGVCGASPGIPSMDDLCRRNVRLTGGGSDEGPREMLFFVMVRGVTGGN